MNSQETLDLHQVLNVLRRRLWLLLALPVAAAATAAVLSLYVLPPVYTASTTLWVVKKDTTGPVNLDAVLLSQNLTKTYAEVAKSRLVMDKTITQLGLNVSPEQLLKKITVTTVRDTEILAIAVDDRDSAQAAAIANSLADQFMQELPKFIALDNVRVVDKAARPKLPVSPKKLLNTALAFVLGVMVAVGAAFLLDSLDVSVRSPDDIERYFALPVLGVVPFIETGTGGSSTGQREKVRRRHRAESVPTIQGAEDR